MASCGLFSAPFEVHDYARWRLLEGLDDIGLTLCHEAEIDAYEACRPAILPPATHPEQTRFPLGEGLSSHH